MKKATTKKKAPTASPLGEKQRNSYSPRMRQAELSLQRGDVENAKSIILNRLHQGAEDFKTHNMLGICHANLHQFEDASAIFSNLLQTAKNHRERERASHNLALVKLFQDLAEVGDLSALSHSIALPPVSSSSMRTRPEPPFSPSISIWQQALARPTKYTDILLCYCAYAFWQQGNLEDALSFIRKAIAINENFYISQFILGKLFLDLVQMGIEGDDYLLDEPNKVFFEIDDAEIAEKHGDRYKVRTETLLDIGLQALLDARELNNYAPEVLLGLAQAYLMAGMFEEADQTISLAESLAPDAVPILDLHLLLMEQMQPEQKALRTMVTRISNLRRRGWKYQLQYILPPYYLG